MKRWLLLHESEAGTPQSSLFGQGLLRARKIGLPTILPRPHVLGFMGQAGVVKVGTYVWESPVYNAQPGRGFNGQVSLGPSSVPGQSPQIVGG